MKILALSQHYREENGGSAVYTRNICRAMAAEGHSVYLVTEQDEKTFADVDEWKKADGYWIKSIPSGGCHFWERRSQMEIRAINAAVRRELDHWISSLNIDVVHVLHGYRLAQTVLSRVPKGKRGFWTIFNVPPQEYTCKLMAKLPILNKVAKKIYFALAKVVNENILRNSPCVRLICISNQTRKLALLAGVPPKRAVVVPVGIDAHLFAPAPGGGERTTKAEQGTPLILTVAGVIPHKGQLDMIEAMKIIVGELKDARYINIGAIRDVAYYSQVLSRMEELGLENRCCFLGHIPHSDMLRLYHACDVYVQPSHQDGFNMSALQALSCGKQVVVTQAGAMPEYVEQIGAGRVVAPGLPEQLANAVIDLANSGDAIDPHKQHVKVAALYDWSVIARETLRIYKSLEPTAVAR